MKVVLTNSHGYFDGAGAQVQRILSLVAFSRFMGFEFKLNPIQKVELQPLEREDFSQNLSAEIKTLNNWLKKYENLDAKQDCLDFDPVDNLKELLKTVFRCSFRVTQRNSQTKVIGFAMLDGYQATRSIPHIWKCLHEPATAEVQRTALPESVNIHVHFRISTFSESSDRNLPVDYYQILIEHLVHQAALLGVTPKLVIHTDFFGHPVPGVELRKTGVPESLLYWRELNLVDNLGNANLQFIESSRAWLREFLERYENVTYIENSDWISEWESMASADYLVASKSSFSLIGGLLNRQGKVIAPSNWGVRLNNWTLVDPDRKSVV